MTAEISPAWDGYVDDGGAVCYDLYLTDRPVDAAPDARVNEADGPQWYAEQPHQSGYGRTWQYFPISELEEALTWAAADTRVPLPEMNRDALPRIGTPAYPARLLSDGRKARP